MRVEKLAYGSIVLDTLTASAVQNGSRLEYALRVANAPGNLDNIALAGVYGHVVRNTGAVNFYQKNRAGREGFRFGVDAAWNDSLIRASVTPLAPVFGSGAVDSESRQLPRLPVRRKPERRPRHDSRRPAVCDPYRSGNRLAPRHPARHRRAEHRRSAGDAPLRPARRRRAGRPP